MIRKSVYNGEYPDNKIQVIECREDSTAEGEILLDVDRLDEVLEYAGSIFLCTPPDCEQDNWTTLGVDLSDSTNLDISIKKLSTGKNVVIWRFDPSQLTPDNNTFYALTININSNSDSSESQAGIEMIIKIKNSVVAGV